LATVGLDFLEHHLGERGKLPLVGLLDADGNSLAQLLEPGPAQLVPLLDSLAHTKLLVE